LTHPSPEDGGSDPFEEIARRLESIASKLKPFATRRAGPADYDKVELPRPSEVFFLTPTPQPAPLGVIPRELLTAETICDRTIGLHRVIAEGVIDGTIDPSRPLENDLLAGVQFSVSFRPLALTYGYAGMVIQRIKRDMRPLIDDTVYEWTHEIRGPSDGFLEAIAEHVTRNGRDGLDELSLDQPTSEATRRLIDKGVPVFLHFLRGLYQDAVTVYTSDPHRTAPSREIEEAEDLLTEIGVFWLSGFRWRWCTNRTNPHWYIAGHQEQYGCVRHGGAVQQDRYRHQEKKRRPRRGSGR
jgi:hypothetical protein